MDLDKHCGRGGCICTHTHPCDRGWKFVKYIDKTTKKGEGGIPYVVETEYEGVVPCGICDFERAEIAATSKTSWEMGERLRARSNANRSKAYESDQESKTRTL